MRRLYPGGGRAVWLGSAALALGLALGCGRSDDPQTYFDTGAKHFQKGDLDRAIASYEQGLQLEPGSAVGHNLIGMAYRMKYNTLRTSEWKEKEIEAFTEAVTADSTYWPAYINLGATLYYMGRKTDAAPHFRRALEIHPDNPEREELEKFIREGSPGPSG